MGNKIANLKVKGAKKNNPKLKTGDGFMLPFYQNENTLSLDSLNTFIKGCEKLIRTSIEYDNYKSHLLNIGLDHCMVLPNVTSNDAPIEMHHGPILTLYDCCKIVIQSLLKRGQKITSYRVAYIVLKEHELNNIQVVMLCETVHKLVHDKEIYINTHQAWGDINKFIEKYKDGIDEDTDRGIKLNFEIADEYHSTDRGILDLEYKIKNWSK